MTQAKASPSPSPTQAMSDRRVDYDQIAPSYNRRYAANSLAQVTDTLLALTQEVVAERILEVGCGTGRWLADLTNEHRQLWGLDASVGMLRQARQRPIRLDLVRGTASRIAFPDAAFDLVFCVNAIHHFDDPAAFVSEAHRLLRPGGALAVIGSNPHDRRGAWYAYDYFEGTLETDLRRFPSWGTALDWMVTEGFEPVEWRLVQRIVDHKTGRDVLSDPFLQKNACSQLALLSDEAYAAGLRRIKAALEETAAAGETIVFPAEIHLGALIGRLPDDEHRE